MALRLHWPDERYARIYCRDTIDWQSLSWDAQALWMQLNRKATRLGRIDLGRAGRRGIPALVGRPEMASELLDALARLEEDGCVRVEGNVLVIEEFVEAQEAVSSVKARVRKHREIAEEEAKEQNPGNESLRQGEGDVTRGYGTVQHGTEGTARPRPDSAAPPAREPTGNDSAPPPLAGDALSQSFAEELEEEASREDKRRGRTLSVLGGAWRTVAEVAEALGRKPRTVEDDLLELKRQGIVERQERPASSSPSAPPVTHWRRKQRAHKDAA